MREVGLIECTACNDFSWLLFPCWSKVSGIYDIFFEFDMGGSGHVSHFRLIKGTLLVTLGSQ